MANAIYEGCVCRGTPSIGIITNSGLQYDMKLGHYLSWFRLRWRTSADTFFIYCIVRESKFLSRSLFFSAVLLLGVERWFFTELLSFCDFCLATWIKNTFYYVESSLLCLISKQVKCPNTTNLEERMLWTSMSIKVLIMHGYSLIESRNANCMLIVWKTIWITAVCQLQLNVSGRSNQHH